MLNTGRPKFRLLLRPQKSPPDAPEILRLWIAQVAVGPEVPFGIRPRAVRRRRDARQRIEQSAGDRAAIRRNRYLPALTLSAVLPLPNTS